MSKYEWGKSYWDHAIIEGDIEELIGFLAREALGSKQ